MDNDNKNGKKIHNVDNLIKSDDNANSTSSLQEFNEFNMDTCEANKAPELNSNAKSDINESVNKAKRSKIDNNGGKSLSKELRRYESFLNSIKTVKADNQVLSPTDNINKSAITKPNSEIIKLPTDTTKMADNTIIQTNNVVIVNSVQRMESDNTDDKAVTSGDNNTVTNDGVAGNSGTSDVNANPYPWQSVPERKTKRFRKVRINKDDVDHNRFTLLLIDDNCYDN